MPTSGGVRGGEIVGSTKQTDVARHTQAIHGTQQASKTTKYLAFTCLGRVKGWCIAECSSADLRREMALDV